MRKFLCNIGWHSWIYVSYGNHRSSFANWVDDTYGYKRKYCEFCNNEYVKHGDYCPWERVK